MDGLLLPGYVTSIRSLKDGSVVLSIETQELSPMKAGEVFSLRGKLLAMYLSAKDTITQRELDQVDKVQLDMPGKTSSQRVRNILYRIWEVQPEGFKTFEQFYMAKQEQHITALKETLDSLTT